MALPFDMEEAVFLLNNGIRSEGFRFDKRRVQTQTEMRYIMVHAGLKVTTTCKDATCIVIPNGASAPGEKLLRRGGRARLWLREDVIWEWIDKHT